MKKENKLEREIEIPEGIDIDVKGSEIIIRKGGKELKKKFILSNLEIMKKDSKIIIKSKKATKRELKLIGTYAAHIINMIKGVQNDFVYKLEIANIHFPMNAKVEGNIFAIKNFLGEKVSRKAEIYPGVKVEIKGIKVEVSSPDREAAGQTAANIERATKVKGRDRRIFQDGIFITEKPGRIL